MQTLRKIFSPLASLRLTVILLATAMVLVFAGTLAQRDTGIWQVQHQFFHSWVCWIALKDLIFVQAPGSLPFVGGYTLIVLLLVNLLAAHLTRFKLRWNRTGVILTHVGLIMLLVGEIITSVAATEGTINFKKGEAVNYTQDIRAYELAITDASPADHDAVTVIPTKLLRQSGQTLRDPRLPFDVTVEDYYDNSQLLGPMQEGEADPRVNAGSEVGRKIKKMAPFSGTGEDADRIDAPDAILTLSKDGKPLGTYSFSFWSGSPQTVKLPDGKAYQVQLRYKRAYKPFTVELLKFTHDTFVGTNLDKNFASTVRLVDPSRGVDRQAVIWMNHPLRYAGETFYQQLFGKDPVTKLDTGYTTLQVVHNPGAIIPYLALGIAMIGLIVQFGGHLMGFLRKRRTMSQKRRAAELDGTLQAQSQSQSQGRKRNGAVSSASAMLSPRPQSRLGIFNLIVPAVVTIVCGFIVLGAAVRATPTSDGGYNVDAFGALPVYYGGRAMPLDTLARVALKIIHGNETITRGEQTVKPTQWLLDLMGRADSASSYDSFRIDNPEVLNAIGQETNRKYFSFADLLKQQAPLQKQVMTIIEAERNGTYDENDLTSKKMAEFAEHLSLYINLRDLDTLYMVPPLKAEGKWQTVGDSVKAMKTTGEPPPALRNFMQIVQAYSDSKPTEFNTLVAEDHALVAGLPIDQARVDFEGFFNRFDPFMYCMIFYVVVFIFAAASWLIWQRPLGNTALCLLLLTWLVHSFGLVSRIYISGRPPVTNLYASAIFIAWAAVALAAFLEIVYRNGVGSAVGAVIGFSSLQIAEALAIQGDTMEPLRAVLDTNFWLWTHVPSVTIGYASTFLAGILAVAMIFTGIFRSFVPRLRDDTQWRKTMGSMVYGIVCFALLFSFIGTILGGIWADQSWGRFWGWDAKENGAILIVLWNAVILHARWGGLVRERGMANLAVFGNIVTSWSWFGTNMLGVGLHSYGFMEKAFPVLIAFVVSQVVIILIGVFLILIEHANRPPGPPAAGKRRELLGAGA